MNKDQCPGDSGALVLYVCSVLFRLKDDGDGGGDGDFRGTDEGGSVAACGFFQGVDALRGKVVVAAVIAVDVAVLDGFDLQLADAGGFRQDGSLCLRVGHSVLHGLLPGSGVI